MKVKIKSEFTSQIDAIYANVLHRRMKIILYAFTNWLRSHSKLLILCAISN